MTFPSELIHVVDDMSVGQSVYVYREDVKDWVIGQVKRIAEKTHHPGIFNFLVKEGALGDGKGHIVHRPLLRTYEEFHSKRILLDNL